VLGRFAAIAPDGSVYSCQRFCGHAKFALGNVTDDLTEAQILKSAAYRHCWQNRKARKWPAGRAFIFRTAAGMLYSMFASIPKKTPTAKPTAQRSTRYRAIWR
jgi:uncharacterized protein